MEKQKAINCDNSTDNNFLIRQISENEFIILKKIKTKTIKGHLWWKKTKVEEGYRRVDEYGYPLFVRQCFTNIGNAVIYKTKEDAERWIANHKKYPIDYRY